VVLLFLAWLPVLWGFWFALLPVANGGAGFSFKDLMHFACLDKRGKKGGCVLSIGFCWCCSRLLPLAHRHQLTSALI